MSKRARTQHVGSSSQAAEYDTHRFCSVKAQERFESTQQKSFVQERNVDFNTGLMRRGADYDKLTCYIETVERLQWEVYGQPLEGFYAPFVHEFYANLLESTDCRC